MRGHLPPGMVILTSSEALRAAALAAIPATPATPAIPAAGSDYGNDSEIFVTQSPLEALWALARRSATAASAAVFVADIRSLAFREREILAAARAACPAARLVAMGESEDELQLRGVLSAVDELAVGASEVRRAVRRTVPATSAATVAAGVAKHGRQQRAAAVRMMTLDAESGLRRRVYIEPYINALLREARRRQREVLVAVARPASQGQSGRGTTSAAEVQQVGRWLSGIMKDSHVGRWDETTVVAAIPVRNGNQLHLARRLIEGRENGDEKTPLAAAAMFPWDGETAETLVAAASKKFERVR